MSVVKIITADTYDDDGFPIDQGLMDTHLGVIEPGLMCKTCGHKVDECPGHFGNIDLAMPVIHVGYVKEIKKLLQATCKSCGRLVLTEDDVKEYQARLDTMEELGSDAIDLREFAKETAKATEDISAKIEAIQNDTNSSVESITGILSIIDQIAEFQDTIAAAVEEQAATTSQAKAP